MFDPQDIQRLRSQSNDASVYQSLLQNDPEFKSKVDRVQQSNPNMTEFEKLKFPSAMLDIHLGKTQKSSPIQQQTANMVNTGMKPVQSPFSQGIGSYLGQTAMNVLPSTGRLIGGVANLAMHPLQTGKSLIQLGVGGAANTLESIASIAGVKNAEDIFDLSSEEVASAVRDFYVQRYGSLEAAATTLRDDPAGFLSDLGAVVTGVGGVLKGGATAVGGITGAATRTSTALTGLGRGLRATQAVGESLVKTGINMEPLVITGKGVVMAGRGVTNAAKAGVKAILPEVKVTKALKINPSDIRSFQNLPGNELPGQFLMRKGILGGGDIAVTAEEGLKMTGISPVGRTRTGIIDDLEKIAVKAKATVDGELAAVRQTYDLIDDAPQVMKAMEELRSTAAQFGLEREVSFVDDLLKNGRVSLTEANAVKREMDKLYSLFNRSNEPTASLNAERLRRIRSAVREFIEVEAEKKGLPDIGVLNQDTMKAHEILDAIHKADAASWSKGKLGIGLMDGLFGIGAYGATGDIFTTAGIVIGRRIYESTLFQTTMAKYLNRLDPRQIQILQKALKSMKHTTESKQVLRKVVAQTADDVKNQRIAEAEFNPLPRQAQQSVPGQSVMSSSQTTLPSQTPRVNPLELSRNGAADDLAKKFPDLTPEEIMSLTPEERATGLIGGSDSVAKVGQSTKIPKELESLATEARKYKSAEEFMKNLKFKMGGETIEGFKSVKQGILGTSYSIEDFYRLANQSDDIIKTASPLPVSDSVAKALKAPVISDDLLREAKKYKSAEEFVKAHGGVKKTIADIRTDKSLDVKINYGNRGGVMTRKEFVDKAMKDGAKFVERTYPDYAKTEKLASELQSIKRNATGNEAYNRAHFPRMYEIQDILDNGGAKKIKYFAEYPDGGLIDTTKYEYQYAQKQLYTSQSQLIDIWNQAHSQ